jgi:hypothetical protein
MKQTIAVKNLMARLRRNWRRPCATINMHLVGGPFDGQHWACTSAHRHSLMFTAKGVTGRYVAGKWMPADERSA